MGHYKRFLRRNQWETEKFITTMPPPPRLKMSISPKLYTNKTHFLAKWGCQAKGGGGNVPEVKNEKGGMDGYFKISI